MSIVQYPGRYHSVSLSTKARNNYTVNSYFPSRKPRPSSIRGQRNFRKDINCSMQHAALINIVAAVNEDIGDRQQELRKGSASTFSSTRSNVTIYSNSTFLRDKTISIPQTKQRDFSLPEKVVQKKPVYYKHSKDLEVHNQSRQIRLFEDGDSYRFKVKQSQLMEKEKLADSENKTKSKLVDKKNVETKTVKKTDDKNIKRDCDSRMSSGIRRLGILKKTEQRQLHEIHKCDAIDLSDNHSDFVDPAKSALNDSRKLIPSNQMNRIPYIRTKSLPVMFPTKTTSRLPWSLSSASQKTPLVLTDRPLSRSLRQRTPDSMYKRISNLPGGFGYDEMSINNGVNEAPDIASSLVHDSSKTRNVSGTVGHRLKRSGVIRSPSSPILGREAPVVFVTTSEIDKQTTHNQNRRASQSNLYKSKRALHEAVKRVLNGRSMVCDTSISRKIPIEERTDTQTSRYKRSYQLSRSTTSEVHHVEKVSKKVQFQSESSVDSSDVSSTIHEPKTTENDLQGGSNILKTQTCSVRSFSPGIQPMSTKELLRLEQKILPVNGQSQLNVDSAMFFSTTSGIHLQKSNSDLSIKTNSNDSNGRENKVDESVISDNNDNNEDNDYSDGAGDPDIECDDVDGANIHKIGNLHSSEFYKLVKAVDNNPYTGYEHKKLRRSASTAKSKESDTSKAQYVKVKIS